MDNKKNKLIYEEQSFCDTPDELYCPYIYESDNPIYSLNKNEDCVAVCAETVFGISALYPWQRLAIANILDAVNSVDEFIDMLNIKNKRNDIIQDIIKNHDNEHLTELYDEDGIMRGKQIILLPTGAGKSLCFQIPALLLDKPTVVIYPLLALMSDQFRRMNEAALHQNGLKPVIFRGGQTGEERKKQIARMEGTDGYSPAKIIIANPEVLLTGDLIEKIAARNVAHIAIDEAHCVSEWGDGFRPAYLKLPEIIRKLNPYAVTAFTATASSVVLNRISEILFDGKAHLLRGESDRANIIYFVKHCIVKEPALLAEVERRKKPMVIFCSSRKSTEQTASFLRLYFKNDNIRFYHAGLQSEEKVEIENWFHLSKNGILVTTCAWGMGVDKKDVKTVIHRDPPPTAEAYIQEAGRGGRDGSTAEAVMLWSFEDKTRIDMMPEKQRYRAKVISEFAESGRCRREVLLEAMGEHRAVAQTPAQEVIACSGCDICFNTAVQIAEDETMLMKFIKKNRRVFTQNEAAETISSNLKFWRAGDVKKLITYLIDLNMIKTQSKFLWKEKLDIA